MHANTMLGWTSSIKNFIKLQNVKCNNLIQNKNKEQKEHLTNSMKLVESDLANMSKEMETVITEIKNISAN